MKLKSLCCHYINIHYISIVCNSLPNTAFQEPSRWASLVPVLRVYSANPFVYVIGLLSVSPLRKERWQRNTVNIFWLTDN